MWRGNSVVWGRRGGGPGIITADQQNIVLSNMQPQDQSKAELVSTLECLLSYQLIRVLGILVMECIIAIHTNYSKR